MSLNRPTTFMELQTIVAVKCACCAKLLPATGTYIVVESLKFSEHPTENTRPKRDFVVNETDIVFCNINCFRQHLVDKENENDRH